MIEDLLDLDARAAGRRHSAQARRSRPRRARAARRAGAAGRASRPPRSSVAQEGDLTGDWDADRLAQVASNLIGNALAARRATASRCACGSTARDAGRGRAVGGERRRHPARGAAAPLRSVPRRPATPAAARASASASTSSSRSSTPTAAASTSARRPTRTPASASSCRAAPPRPAARVTLRPNAGLITSSPVSVRIVRRRDLLDSCR